MKKMAAGSIVLAILVACGDNQLQTGDGSSAVDPAEKLEILITVHRNSSPSENFMDVSLETADNHRNSRLNSGESLVALVNGVEYTLIEKKNVNPSPINIAPPTYTYYTNLPILYKDDELSVEYRRPSLPSLISLANLKGMPIITSLVENDVISLSNDIELLWEAGKQGDLITVNVSGAGYITPTPQNQKVDDGSGRYVIPAGTYSFLYPTLSDILFFISMTRYQFGDIDYRFGGGNMDIITEYTLKLTAVP